VARPASASPGLSAENIFQFHYITEQEEVAQRQQYECYSVRPGSRKVAIGGANVVGRPHQQKIYDGHLLFKRVYTARRDKDAFLPGQKDE
jgi:hypothetical protein